MDYSKIMNELDEASLFDLYRLRAAINKELDNPERIGKIRRLIKVGETVRYFVDEENRLIEAEVLEIKRTRVLVRNKHDLKRWDIPFFMINLEGVPVDIVRPEIPKELAGTKSESVTFTAFETEPIIFYEAGSFAPIPRRSLCSLSRTNVGESPTQCCTRLLTDKQQASKNSSKVLLLIAIRAKQRRVDRRQSDIKNPALFRLFYKPLILNAL